MTRWGATAPALEVCLDGRPGEGEQLAAAAGAQTGDPWFHAVRGYAAFLECAYAEAAEHADRALAETPETDAVGRLLALAVRGLAAAGWWPGPPGSWADAGGRFGDALGAAVDRLPAIDRDRSAEADFARYVVAEAALACGRLDLAARVVEVSGAAPDWPRADGSGRAPHDIVGIMRVRLAAFRGRIDDAERMLREIEAPPRDGLSSLLVASTASLVRGNAADAGAARALADLVEFSDIAAENYLSGGCRLLAAFGLAAIGDVARAARLVLLAGGGADLGALTLIDRALGLELLVALAAASSDLDAAEAWAEQAVDLRDHPISGSTIARLDSRVALLAGRVREAVALADLGVERARAEGRVVEAAEGEIVGSRARLAASQAGIALVRLETAVAEADRTGHRSVRRSAARELRSSGRRLRPSAGAGWEALSVRERDVALLVAHGATNAGIARALHVSEHTVRAHVSRVLAAYGAASRHAVAEALADRVPEGGTPATLTARQRDVADGVARGFGNAAIATRLGISVKTVEKHLADIRMRWQVSTRGEVARRARSVE